MGRKYGKGEKNDGIEEEFAKEILSKVGLLGDKEKIFIGVSGINFAGKTTFAKQLQHFFQQSLVNYKITLHTIEESIDQISQSLHQPFNQSKHYYESCYDTSQVLSKLNTLSHQNPGEKEIYIIEGLLLFKNTLLTQFPLDIRIWVDCTFTTAQQRINRQIGDFPPDIYKNFMNWTSRIHFSIDNPKNEADYIYILDDTLLRPEHEFINLQRDYSHLFDNMKWLSPPPFYSILSLRKNKNNNKINNNNNEEKKILYVKTEKQSDYWQRTHYGFQNDNAHLLYTEIEGDFTLYCKVSYQAKHQFDQSGLCVRIDHENWIKTSIEFELNNPPKLGVVVTNFGYSDWSVQELTRNLKANSQLFNSQFIDINGQEIDDDILESLETVEFRIEREEFDYKVESRLKGENEWRLMRICHLHLPSPSIKCGIYCCSPIDDGYQVFFHDLHIREKFF